MDLTVSSICDVNLNRDEYRDPQCRHNLRQVQSLHGDLPLSPQALLCQAATEGEAGLPLEDPLASWFQQHFIALDAAGMLGLPYACSAESGRLPEVCV